MRHLIHRVIERRDCGDHPKQRRALCVDTALLAMMGQVATKNLAVVFEHFIGTKQKHITDATGFVRRILHAQARFCRNECGHFVLSTFSDVCGAIENRRSLKAGKRRTVRMHGGIGVSHFVERGFGYCSDLLFGVGVMHRNHAVSAAIGANFSAHQTHRIKLVVENKLVDHDG